MTIREPQCRKAMTLIEVLITAAIVAVLAALIFPALRGMSERASGATCAANLRQFGAALLLYRADHDGYLPPGRLLPPTDTSQNNNPTDGVDLKKELTEGGYFPAKELPYCPATRLSKKGRENLKPGQSAKSLFQEQGSYALNIFLTQTKIEALPGPYFGDYPYPGDAKMLLAAEAYFCGITNSLSHQNFTLNGVDFGTLYNHAPRSHGDNRLNFMFLDGHIEMLSPKVTGQNATGQKTYDWTDVFDSWGRNGKAISQRTAYKPQP